MQECIRTTLLIMQLLLFILGSIMDDMNWYDFGVPDEITTFQAITVAAMSICICPILQIVTKCHIDLLFYRSQLKFFFSWTLIATTIICSLSRYSSAIMPKFIKFYERYYKGLFACALLVPYLCLSCDTKGSENPLVLTTGECVVDGAGVFLTNLNLSLICNTKAHPLELWTYLAVLFAEIVTDGKLFLLFVHELHEKEKDQSILLVSLIITNQIIVMDLIFRAAYEEREREEMKEEKMLHHRKKAQVSNSHNTIPSINNLPVTAQKFRQLEAEDFPH